MTPIQRIATSSKAQSYDEKRISRRQKIYSDIWVDSDDAPTPILCKVLDISHTGAKMLTRADSVLPDAFNMHIGASKYSAKVMWRSGQEIGVEFQTPKDVPATQWDRYAPQPLEPRDPAPPGPDEPPNEARAATEATREAGENLDAALARLRLCLDRMKR